MCFWTKSKNTTTTKQKTRHMLSETKAIMSPPRMSLDGINFFVEGGEIVN